jgi:hypothetical protein
MTMDFFIRIALPLLVLGIWIGGAIFAWLSLAATTHNSSDEEGYSKLQLVLQLALWPLRLLAAFALGKKFIRQEASLDRDARRHIRDIFFLLRGLGFLQVYALIRDDVARAALFTLACDAHALSLDIRLPVFVLEEGLSGEQLLNERVEWLKVREIFAALSTCAANDDFQEFTRIADAIREREGPSRDQWHANAKIRFIGVTDAGTIRALEGQKGATYGDPR